METQLVRVEHYARHPISFQRTDRFRTVGRISQDRVTNRVKMGSYLVGAAGPRGKHHMRGRSTEHLFDVILSE